MDAPAEKKLSFFQQVRGLPGNFWTANVMEMFERLAFFSVTAMRSLFVVAASGENGLGLSHMERGVIFAIWSLVQCLVPMVSGGYTERYGYRRSLLIAFAINILGYLLMAWSVGISLFLTDLGVPGTGFFVFLAAACLVALGTGVFKPPVQGTVAKATTEQTSSVGWGVFYWVVNIGATAAPFVSAWMRGSVDWHWVFYAAALWTAINYIPALLLFKEPSRPTQADQATEEGPIGVFLSSIGTMFKDPRLIMFMLIFSMFFLMFMQLWDLLPIFIDEWVNTSDVYSVFKAIHPSLVTESKHAVKPEMIINIDAAAIILLVIPISFLIARMNKVAAMILGMLVGLVGFVGSGLTNIGAICCLMVFVFAIGEMLCSPTFTAYIGLIAPKDKKALYMGYSNMPFAIGWFLGNLIGGYLYGAVADKIRFAREYMIEHFNVAANFAEDEALLPKDQVMPTLARIADGANAASLQARMEELKATVEAQGLSAAESLQAMKTGYAEILGNVPHERIQELTNTLWDLHDPWMVWVYLGAIGLAGTLGMILFYIFSKTPSQEQTQTQSA
jgi:POT family proton-dependent oligopeptide transporter